MILLTVTDIASAAQMVERIRVNFSRIEFPTIGRLITASFGVAMKQPKENGQTCVKRADNALYKSKSEGRNRVSVA